MARRKKHPGGRPPREKSASARVVSVRCTEAEHAAWTAAAGDRPLSDWLRELANARA